jgi:hypothetical protein
VALSVLGVFGRVRRQPEGASSLRRQSSRPRYARRRHLRDGRTHRGAQNNANPSKQGARARHAIIRQPQPPNSIAPHLRHRRAHRDAQELLDVRREGRAAADDQTHAAAELGLDLRRSSGGQTAVKRRSNRSQTTVKRRRAERKEQEVRKPRALGGRPATRVARERPESRSLAAMRKERRPHLAKNEAVKQRRRGGAGPPRLEPAELPLVGGGEEEAGDRACGRCGWGGANT